MSVLPVLHPCIPFVGAIPGGLYCGSMIRIHGQMLHCGGFAVNISNSPAHSLCGDTILHLSVRPYEHVIVRNHMAFHAWGLEERYGWSPIDYGFPFEILILAETQQFRIAVNGQHFCEFRYRLPLSAAQFVHVEGEVQISSIQIELGPCLQTPPPPYCAH